MERGGSGLETCASYSCSATRGAAPGGVAAESLAALPAAAPATGRTGRPADLPYADAMRTVGVLAVVFVHTAGRAVMRPGDLPPLSWWSANVFDSLCRWGVPVFLMLSGALNLDPARREGPFAFYRRRLARVGLPLVFWSAFYFLWWALFQQREITARGVVDEIAAGLVSSHLYYLVVILGLYLCAPALRIFVRRTPPAAWSALAAGLLALAASGLLEPVLPRNAFTLFVPYLGYFVMGLALRELDPTKGRALLAWATFLAASATIAIGTGLLFDRWGPSDYRSQALYDYLHPAVIGQSLAAFLILRRGSGPTAGTRSSRLFRTLGPLAFGIYLVHVAVLDVVHRFLAAVYARATALVIPLEVGAVFVLSAGVVMALRRVPFLRRVTG